MRAVCLWVKSSYSDDEGANCVEVAVHPHGVRVRDSKNVTGSQLAIPAHAWEAFIGFAATSGA